MSDNLMSDASSDGLQFNNRTTNANFQERLLQAQSMEDTFHDGIRFEDFNFMSDTDELRKKRDELEEQVKRMESRVDSMEKKLELRRAKRHKEAGLTNMTPEERAAHVELEEKKWEKKRSRQERLLKKQQMDSDEDESMQVSDTDEEEEEEEETDPDWDVVFEYMLLLESDDVSGNDYLQPSADIRKNAFMHQDVLRQTKYSSLKIIEAKNKLERNPIEDVEVRHCDLAGVCYDQKFHVTFDVQEPAMTIANLEFEVDIEMQLDVGDVLQKIKDECNMMGFFRLLVHYATLDKQRTDVLRQLTEHYKDTSIHVEPLSPSRLKLEGNTEYGVNLLFSWTMTSTNMEKETLDANIESHVKPVLTLEAIALSTVLEKDANNVLDKINDVFMFMIERQGVFKSIDYIVNKTLM